MAEARGAPRLGTVLRWLLVLAMLAFFASDALEPDDPDAMPSEEPGAAGEELAVIRLKPLEVPPLGATLVVLDGIDERNGAPISATIDKKAAEVVYRKGPEIVVRLPEADSGRHKLRVQQGERRSKAVDVWVKPLARRKMATGLVGGLALFVLGLRLLQRGLRAYAGGRLKETIARWTGSAPRGLGVGVLAGAITQSPASSTAVLVGLIESRLLAIGPSLAVLLGAQVGAAVTVLLLPLGSAREGLVVVAVGVAWLGLSIDRRSGAVGSILTGFGLLLYGVQLLRGAFQPLVADPAVLPYVRHFAEPGAHGLLTSAAAGVAVSALTQGPGPTFALALGLAQSSGLIGLREGLAILGGTALGSALGALAVAWPFGRDARRLGLGYLVVGGAITAAMLVTLPLWQSVADALAPGKPETLAYGRKILLPNVGSHLAIGFVVCQIVLAVVILPLLPAVSALVERLAGRTKTRGARAVTPEALSGMRQLGDALDALREALALTTSMVKTRDRAPASEIEALLRAARAAVDSLLRQLAGTDGSAPESAPVSAAAIAFSQLHGGVSALARLAERGIEEGLELEPEDQAAVEALSQRVDAALDSLRQTLSGASATSLEAARVLEIRINAEELERRHRLTERLQGGSPAAVPRRVHVTALLAAYEASGNYLFRAHEALAGDSED